LHCVQSRDDRDNKLWDDEESQVEQSWEWMKS
jgi:hypothetical protein